MIYFTYMWSPPSNFSSFHIVFCLAFFLLILWIYFFYFFLIFIFKLYIIVLVLPNIKLNPPRVYMCPPSWTLLPPPSTYHPSGSSQCTSPKHPVSWHSLSCMSFSIPPLSGIAWWCSLYNLVGNSWFFFLLWYSLLHSFWLGKILVLRHFLFICSSLQDILCFHVLSIINIVFLVIVRIHVPFKLKFFLDIWWAVILPDLWTSVFT